MSANIWYIKKCKLFERLSDFEANKLNRVALTRKFKKKTLVYSPSDSGDYVLVLAAGRVKIFDVNHDGRETILTFIESGELFGELSALSGERRQEFAEAVEDTTLLAIPREEFMQLLAGRSDLSLSITKLIGLRRQRIEARLRQILFLSSRERLIFILAELIDMHGQQNGTQFAIRFPLSHQELANLIGLSRETVTATLGQLQNEGLVNIQRQRVSVPDLPALRAAGQLANSSMNIPPTQAAPIRTRQVIN